MPRIGVNPQKNREIQAQAQWHRVIVPVYVREDIDFMKEAAEVVKLCVRSIIETTGEETSLSVILNEAPLRLERELFRIVRKCGRAELIIKGQNVGKVEALFSVFRGTHEPFVTLSDSDVVFRRGWFQRTMEIFQAFPEVGAVSALPVPHLRRYHTNSTYFGASLRGVLRVGRFARTEDLLQYMADLESPNLITNWAIDAQPAIVRGNVTALIGCTHMQATYRRQALESAPKRKCMAAMGLGSEEAWMDVPPDRSGWWKVSLMEAYVRHLGNRMPPGIASESGDGSDAPVSRPPDVAKPVESVIPRACRSVAGSVIQRLVEGRLRRK